jgi:hypothetical protein
MLYPKERRRQRRCIGILLELKGREEAVGEDSCGNRSRTLTALRVSRAYREVI